MNKSFFRLGLGLLLVLQGCQTLKQQGEVASLEPTDGSSAPVVLPFPEPDRVKRELDEDLIYSYLVGEIGAHRGELRLSQTHYQHAAILARDAYAAERATRIALHLKDYQAGLAAARRWVELDPNNIAARQLYSITVLVAGIEREVSIELSGV